MQNNMNTLAYLIYIHFFITLQIGETYTLNCDALTDYVNKVTLGLYEEMM